MARISDLSDELLVKIISFLPTEKAVSTSLLSKRWEFLWMWLPKLEFNFNTRSKSAYLRDFITKYLPLHKAPIIESLHLCFLFVGIEPEVLKSWVETAVSRCVPELRISLSFSKMIRDVSLPRCLYSCNSLVTLKLHGDNILVGAPPTACLPSLKTLELLLVTYSNENSLQRLLTYCPVLEDLSIAREYYDNLPEVVIRVPSLQRLTLYTGQGCSSGVCVIKTPSLKSFNVIDHRETSLYLIVHMPELEEADIRVMLEFEELTEMLLKPITTVKRLTCRLGLNSGEEEEVTCFNIENTGLNCLLLTLQIVLPDGIVFSQLENLKLYKCCENWSKLLVQLLKVSPNLQILQILNVLSDDFPDTCGWYEPVGWSDNHSTVPKCFSTSFESFKFEGYSSEEPEDRDLVSFIFKHALRLKSISILHR